MKDITVISCKIPLVQKVRKHMCSKRSTASLQQQREINPEFSCEYLASNMRTCQVSFSYFAFNIAGEDALDLSELLKWRNVWSARNVSSALSLGNKESVPRFPSQTPRPANNSSQKASCDSEYVL